MCEASYCVTRGDHSLSKEVGKQKKLRYVAERTRISLVVWS